MTALTYSLIIYFVGVSIVLYIRPSVMFRSGGTWKEFGLYNTENNTYLPFWLFAIIWALISYFIGVMIVSNQASSIMNVPAYMTDIIDTNDSLESNLMQEMLPLAPPTRLNKGRTSIATPISERMGMESRNGYYVLDKAAFETQGVPQYIYYGPSAPPTATQ